MATDQFGADRNQVVCFSDTFGAETNNGVGRFLQDLNSKASNRVLPIHFFVPGKLGTENNVRYVRAPSFSVPGYPDLKIAMPLEHQRRQITHELKKLKPDVIHVSTPGPIGCLGMSLARELRLPLVGIYHTDFPGYASSIVRSQIEFYRNQPEAFLEHPAVNSVKPFVQNQCMPWALKLMLGNPQFSTDVGALKDIFSRNLKVLAGDNDWAETIGNQASRFVARILKQFYSGFTLVIARSQAQVQRIQDSLGLDASVIRCLVPGIDVQKFHPEHANVNFWKRFESVSLDSFKVIYVGRISSEKNFNFLLSIWQELQNQRKENDRRIELIVVGRGDQKLTKKASELPDVTLTGALCGNDLSTAYASSDLLVFPSTTETLGQVGLEAGASGLPSLVADQGGPKMYIQPDTGMVLPTSDPILWAEQVLRFSRDRDAHETFSNSARTHIAKYYSFNASIESYCQIHREAVEIETSRRRQKAKKKARISSSPLEIYESNQKGILVITDYHAGKRFGNQSVREQKRNAIRAMLKLGVKENLDIIYGGDFSDHGSRPDRLAADFEMLREVQEEVGLSEPPLFIRGNHDFGFTDEQLSSLMGGCRVHSSLVYFHPASRVTVTHGHILGLHRVIELINETRSYEQLETALEEDSLDAELKPSVIAYDLANLSESLTRKKGLTGLGNFWEAGFNLRAKLANHFISLGENAPRTDMRTWKLIASLIGSHNDIETAAQLGIACGSWATIFGHTHEPLVRSIRDSNQGCNHLVGNAGNIHRKSPTCIIAKFPEVKLMRFKQRTSRLEIRRRIGLKDKDLRRESARFESDVPKIFS